ncbi:hypothetical protein K438DRAFT_1955595 [Mycena galopus ATCC 62051]|nr:hypothetical protein K438DRAFT_1955595 [Mycena galopus ATCC 62051]
MIRFHGFTLVHRFTAIARHFPKHKALRAYPSSTALPNSPFEPLGYPTLEFLYTLDQFTEMLLALKANGLVFATLLPSADQSNIVEELTSKLSAQLSERGLQLLGPTGPAANTGLSQWFHFPWIVLESSRRQAVFRFTQHSWASANTFNRKMILDTNSKLVNPDPEHSGLPLLILAPRFGHVCAPLSHILSAQALRIIHGLPHSERHQDLECFSGDFCPEDEITLVLPALRPLHREHTPAALIASTSQIRTHSPVSLSPSPPRTRRRISAPFIEVLSSDDNEESGLSFLFFHWY